MARLCSSGRRRGGVTPLPANDLGDLCRFPLDLLMLMHGRYQSWGAREGTWRYIVASRTTQDPDYSRNNLSLSLCILQGQIEIYFKSSQNSLWNLGRTGIHKSLDSTFRLVHVMTHHRQLKKGSKPIAEKRRLLRVVPHHEPPPPENKIIDLH
ncbi:hypothetical protein BDY19DRAFT_907121 [Irpex rosettiformis]|uniref:Uncharacterized protein n=1 Tax=Irpex rosettiformis TaxID=378272 RepID=A0ACB8U1G3_9APHY|nr:hypothetical protein BDY19DRAFT_907121 [Irpex rosettiformis]